MKTKKMIFICVLVGIVLGYLLRGGGGRSHTESTENAASDGEITMYTCSMHPQIRQPAPGLCPICAMDLIPVKPESSAKVGPRSLALSPAARELAKIETASVKRGAARRVVPLAGMVIYDTTRTRNVTMLSEGQIRKIYANYSGMSLRAGEALADVYSPDVFAASRELVVSGTSSSMVAAARQKLRLLGMSEDEINRIAETGKPADTYTLVSPYSGILNSEAWHEGQWLMRGDDIAEIVDTSSVWVDLDAYEQDVDAMKVGQTARLSVEAIPGEEITGNIIFIAPDMDIMKRTLRVRLEVPNPEGRLKAGMFVRANVDVPLQGEPLLIPASAPLITGKRAVVYVESPDDDGVFEGREIGLGPRAGDFYVVTSGLMEGERVAVKGAMRIDSSIQILAKPSMMSPEGESMPAGHQHDAMTPASTERRPQTNCPVEGGTIKRTIFAEYNGLRVYFCCPGCDEEFLNNPEKFIAEMRANGIEPEHVP